MHTANVQVISQIAGLLEKPEYFPFPSLKAMKPENTLSRFKNINSAAQRHGLLPVR